MKRDFEWPYNPAARQIIESMQNGLHTLFLLRVRPIAYRAGHRPKFINIRRPRKALSHYDTTLLESLPLALIAKNSACLQNLEKLS